MDDAVRRNLNSMLVARGYNASDELLEGAWEGETLVASAKGPEDGGLPELFVVVMRGDKAGTREARWVLEQAEQRAATRVVAVMSEQMTPIARKELESSTAVRVELFSVAELAFDLLQHELVPRHRALSEAEKQEVLRKHQCTAEQVPRIKQSDPVCKWLALPKGTLVEVTRSPGLPEQVVSYRVVV